MFTVSISCCQLVINSIVDGMSSSYTDNIIRQIIKLMLTSVRNLVPEELDLVPDLGFSC